MFNEYVEGGYNHYIMLHLPSAERIIACFMKDRNNVYHFEIGFINPSIMTEDNNIYMDIKQGRWKLFDIEDIKVGYPEMFNSCKPGVLSEGEVQ